MLPLIGFCFGSDCGGDHAGWGSEFQKRSEPWSEPVIGLACGFQNFQNQIRVTASAAQIPRIPVDSRCIRSEVVQ